MGRPANYNEFVKASDAKQWLAKMMMEVESLLTNDRGLLRAMSYVESDTNTAYERYNNYTDAPEFVIKILQQGLIDERKHKMIFLP